MYVRSAPTERVLTNVGGRVCVAGRNKARDTSISGSVGLRTILNADYLVA